MAVPWDQSKNILADLNKLCDFVPIRSNMKILPMEGRPSPVPQPEDDPILMPGYDISAPDCDSLEKPDLDLITQTIRNVIPNYSNDCIEEAFGQRGLLLKKINRSKDTVPTDHKPLVNNNSSIDLAGDQLHSDKSYEFKSQFQETFPILESFDRGPAADRKSNIKFDPETPEFIPRAISNANSQKNNHQAHNSNSDNFDTNIKLNRKLIFSNTNHASGVSPEMHLDPKSKLHVESKDIKSIDLSYTQNQSHQIVKPTSVPSGRLFKNNSRNCAFQSIFSQVSKGNTESVYQNIEVNPLIIAQVQHSNMDDYNSSLPKESSNFQASGNEKLSRLNNCFSSKNDLDDISSDSDCDNSVIEVRSSSSDEDCVLLCESEHAASNKRQTEIGSSPIEQQLTRKNIICKESKDKVLQWLNFESRSNAARHSDNVEETVKPVAPKPCPAILSDDAFAFKPKSNNIPLNRHKPSKLVQMMPEEDKASTSVKKSSKLTSSEIYQNLLKKQQMSKSANKDNTYESIFKESKVSSSSNTLWDNIEKKLLSRSKN